MAAADVPVSSTERRIVVLSTPEQPVQRFTGLGGTEELTTFLENIERASLRWPEQTGSERASFLWSHLGQSVREELLCQGVNRNNKGALLGALEETYGDKASLSSLSVVFYSTRQEEQEDVRQYSLRLHNVFRSLNRRRQLENVTVEDQACLKIQLIEGLRDKYVQLSTRRYSLEHPQATFKELRKTLLSWKPDLGLKSCCESTKPGCIPSVRQGSAIENDLKCHFDKQDKVLELQSDTINHLVSSACALEQPGKAMEVKRKVKGQLWPNQQEPQIGLSKRQVYSRPSDTSCHFCGREGHFARSCRFKRRTKNNRNFNNRCEDNAGIGHRDNTRPHLTVGSRGFLSHKATGFQDLSHSHKNRSRHSPTIGVTNGSRRYSNQSNNIATAVASHTSVVSSSSSECANIEPGDLVLVRSSAVTNWTIRDQYRESQRWYKVLDSPTKQNRLCRFLVQLEGCKSFKFITDIDIIAFKPNGSASQMRWINWDRSCIYCKRKTKTTIFDKIVSL